MPDVSVAVEVVGFSETAAVVAVVDVAAAATTCFDRQRPGRTWPRPQCCSTPFSAKKYEQRKKVSKSIDLD